MKKWMALFLAAAFLLTAACTGCAQNGGSQADAKGEKKLLQFTDMTPGEKVAVLHTSMGDIKLRFFPQAAPKAVENFLTHAENGYYNGLTFHRVINDFMIQGGDPTGDGTGGTSIWGTPFEDEFSYQLRNFNGALSMANSGSNTNGSQFFIVQSKSITDQNKTEMQTYGEDFFSKEVVKKYEELGGTPWLDFKHTVFGQVYEGMDVVDAIAAVEVDSSDKPVTPVTIDTVEVLEYQP